VGQLDGEPFAAVAAAVRVVVANKHDVFVASASVCA
jgi:hypothetical protein